MDFPMPTSVSQIPTAAMALKQQKTDAAVSVAVAKQALDVAKIEGNAVVKLIEGSTIDIRV